MRRPRLKLRWPSGAWFISSQWPCNRERVTRWQRQTAAMRDPNIADPVAAYLNGDIDLSRVAELLREGKREAA